MNTNRRNIWSTVITLVLVIVVAVLLWQMLGNTATKIDIVEFYKNLDAGKYSTVYLSGYVVRATDTEGKVYTFNIADRAAFEQKVYDTITGKNLQTKYTASDPNAVSLWDYLFPVLWLGLLIVMGVMMFRAIARQNNQNMDFGKSRARVVQNMKVRFSDVAGAEEEKEELQEVIDFLKDPKKFINMGARVPKGILLVGPPGTGKTLFAKAVAGEAGVPFFSMSGSDFVEMFVGVGASRVRSLFDEAKKNMPCIIFIDEIDAVGRQRGAGLGGGHDEREQTLNQLLVEMDGFETNTSIIIMAATNRADILDPALLRPGRFDRQIYVNRPDVRGREAILKVHARKKPIGPDVDFRTVARITAGFTGADLENLLNEAAILAVRAGRNVITMADVNEGINKVVMGPQKKSRLVTEADKRITAYHESGHAIVASALKYCDPVHEVTIIPRGQAAGYTMTRPENDNNHVTRALLMDNITMTLGGRVAEELVIKNISSGASGDIKSLTNTAHQMVTEWGMSERLGPLFYGSEGEVFVGRSYQSQHSYSDEVANVIDEEVRSIVEECHKRATKILTEKMEVLHNMSRVLLEKETIHHDEVQMLMDGKSAEEVIAYIDSLEYKPAPKRTEVSNTTDTAAQQSVNIASGDDSAKGEPQQQEADSAQTTAPSAEGEQQKADKKPRTRKPSARKKDSAASQTETDKKDK